VPLEGALWRELAKWVQSTGVRPRPAILLLLALAMPPRARATVYAPMDEAALTAASAAIVTGTVTASAAHRRDGRIVTDATVSVDRILKGTVGPSVVVTTPGGAVGDEAAVVFGAPELAVGDAVLLYLQQTASGEVRTTGLALGAYRLLTAADGTVVATRAVPLAETRPLDQVAATVQALGDPGSPIDGGGTGEPTTAYFTFLGSPPGRWFQADQGQPVRFSVANADVELGPSTSNGVIDASLAAWTNVPTASIELRRGGTTGTSPSVAGGTCDGTSRIQFNDPFGEIPPLDGCFGVLAIGGFCTKGNPGVLDGQQFARIAEGDLTIADGLANCVGRTGYEEIVTHEIGHAIGMGHSSENANESDPVLRDATMYFLVHLDGRGASVRADDVAGISALYPLQVDPNDLDGDGIPNADDVCPDTPAGVAVDTNGCGCGEPGHVVCDDGLVCTLDRCDIGTGRCIGVPVDCTNGDPCLTGHCDEASGCATDPVTGDAAVLCIYSRPFPPLACSGERVPRTVRRLLRRASRLAARSLERDDPTLLAAADRRLARARAVIDRAAARRRKPQAPVCAAALAAFVDEARERLPL
jgi:hypothetical protein